MDVYFVAGLLLIAAMGVFLLIRLREAFRLSNPRQITPPTSNPEQDQPGASRHFPNRTNEEGWLRERWRLAQEQEASGSHNGMFPLWYFDKATEAQYDRLDLLDVLYDRNELGKGQAADLIGMFKQPSKDELAVLEFFAVPSHGWKQTRVRHEIAKLFQDPKNIQAWEAHRSELSRGTP